MSKPIVLAVGIFVAIATTFFQAMMANDIVRSNAEAVREARALAEELREVKEASWRGRLKGL